MRATSVYDVETFIRQYVETLLWSELDDNGDSLSDNYDRSDIIIAADSEIRSDCVDFITANARDLAGIESSQAGHDFALSRNGHGTGFFDRGLGDLGDRLQSASKVYGTQGLMPHSDGTLSVHG